MLNRKKANTMVRSRAIGAATRTDATDLKASCIASLIGDMSIKSGARMRTKDSTAQMLPK